MSRRTINAAKRKALIARVAGVRGQGIGRLMTDWHALTVGDFARYLARYLTHRYGARQ